MTTALAPVEFDPYSDEFFNDPTEVYRRLREEAPVYFSQQYDFYALSRFAPLGRYEHHGCLQLMLVALKRPVRAAEVSGDE